MSNEEYKRIQTGLPAFPKLLAVFLAFVFTAVFSVFSVKQKRR